MTRVGKVLHDRDGREQSPISADSEKLELKRRLRTLRIKLRQNQALLRAAERSRKGGGPQLQRLNRALQSAQNERARLQTRVAALEENRLAADREHSDAVSKLQQLRRELQSAQEERARLRARAAGLEESLKETSRLRGGDPGNPAVWLHTVLRECAALLLLSDQTEIFRLDRFTDFYLNEVVSACGGNRSEAARVLGIHRRTLQRMLRKVG